MLSGSLILLVVNPLTAGGKWCCSRKTQRGDPCFEKCPPSLWPIELKIGTELGETYPKNISKVVGRQMLIFGF